MTDQPVREPEEPLVSDVEPVAPEGDSESIVDVEPEGDPAPEVIPFEELDADTIAQVEEHHEGDQDGADDGSDPQ